ncbi:hypothetical protein ACW9HJ_13955 [Nocardia gipuzkoensis]
MTCILPYRPGIDVRVVRESTEDHAGGSLQIHEIAARTAEGYELRLLIRRPTEILNPYLHIFVHGQAKREKYTPPVFYRRGSSRKLGAVCMFLCDPILLYSTHCSIGWHLLGDNKFWPFIGELIGSVLQNADLRGVVWHGSSAGAYAAIRNTLRWPGPSLAIAVAPQNDPTKFYYWPEFLPYSQLAHTARAERLDRLLDHHPLPSESWIHVMVNNKDTYHLLEHVRPLLAHADASPNITVRMIHNDMGHERIGEMDYWSNYNLAERRWLACQP